MPPQRTVRSERTHEENKERAYVAASRRSDRSIEARVESARRASEIHKLRTGRRLRVTEQDVQNENMYEEVDDDVPMRYRHILGPHLDSDSPELSSRVNAYLQQQMAMRETNQMFAQQFPGVPSYSHTQQYMSRTELELQLVNQQNMQIQQQREQLALTGNAPGEMDPTNIYQNQMQLQRSNQFMYANPQATMMAPGATNPMMGGMAPGATLPNGLHSRSMSMSSLQQTPGSMSSQVSPAMLTASRRSSSSAQPALIPRLPGPPGLGPMLPRVQSATPPQQGGSMSGGSSKKRTFAEGPASYNVSYMTSSPTTMGPGGDASTPSSYPWNMSQNPILTSQLPLGVAQFVDPSLSAPFMSYGNSGNEPVSMSDRGSGSSGSGILAQPYLRGTSQNPTLNSQSTYGDDFHRDGVQRQRRVRPTMPNSRSGSGSGSVLNLSGRSPNNASFSSNPSPRLDIASRSGSMSSSATGMASAGPQATVPMRPQQQQQLQLQQGQQQQQLIQNQTQQQRGLEATLSSAAENLPSSQGGAFRDLQYTDITTSTAAMAGTIDPFKSNFTYGDALFGVDNFSSGAGFSNDDFNEFMNLDGLYQQGSQESN